MDRFNQWLKEYLEPRGKTSEVCKNIKIDDETLGRWKKGDFPRAFKQLAELAQFAGIFLDEMLLGYPKSETIISSATKTNLFQARLAKYNLDTLPDDEANRLFDMVEILVNIFSSDSEVLKLSASACLKGLMVEQPSRTKENNRSSPSSSGKPKKTISGGNGAE